MQLCIHSRGIYLTEDMKRRACQKLDLALDRLEDDVEKVSVHLFDTNGPFRGGIDKACRVVVQFRKQDSIVIEDIDSKVDAVLDRVTDRLGVAACKLADSLRGKRNLIRLWTGKDDFPFSEEPIGTKS